MDQLLEEMVPRWAEAMRRNQYLLLNKDGSFQFMDPIDHGGDPYMRIPKLREPFQIQHSTVEDLRLDTLVSSIEVRYRRVRTDVALNGLTLYVEVD